MRRGEHGGDRRARRAERVDVILNACDPRLNPPIFAAAREAGVTYLDMAMTLSERHPDEPYAKPGVTLGDAQFAASGAWEAAGLLGPEAFPAQPFLDLLAEYGAPHGVDEQDPANPGVRRAG
ncbi:hypothetical protein NBH00_03445 [Paraconexibacter antarcticus]|uniref:Saccharopine dehydrogenase NADP binding domain-containing protein n=1 Tax=Paraconexibacter antarcticus TaxID=2949664 RepID=A0ABY5DTC7_9ACTN|nr:hypothetical protein [Paraconexibacter antarcticus]UTI65273.1 hypothetical protein NBH00_03445 [Paraconexibacter antarcticus]